MLIMVNEAARCLEDKIVEGPSDVDVGMIMGTGFPPFRGGLLRYADSVGIRDLVKSLRHLAKTYSKERFTPCALLERIAEDSRGFYA